MSKPKIRFKGCQGEWERKKAKDIFTIFDERKRPDLPVLSAYQDIRGMAIRSESGYDISHDRSNEITYKHVLPGQFVIHLRSFQGGFAHSSVEGITSPAYTVFGFKNVDKYDDYYWKYIFMSKTFISRLKLITYGIRDGRSISFTDFADFEFVIPTFTEQRQIAAYFRSLDGILSGCEVRLSSLRRLKEGALQAFFPQQGETQPRIRFKGCKGEWEKKKLGEIARKVSEKNTQCEYKETFTNSAEMGIISQLDYFDHDITNKANIAGYYVVQPDDFVYNPRISVTAPVGPISRNKLGRCGIMSPLYTVFHFEKVDNGFMEYYFKTIVWHSFMYQEGNTGARNDRFSIKDSVFFTMPILLPPTLAEQLQIANFFRTLDRRIELDRQRLEKLKQLKAACLEKMFV